jgi:hypothetical protein
VQGFFCKSDLDFLGRRVPKTEKGLWEDKVLVKWAHPPGNGNGVFSAQFSFSFAGGLPKSDIEQKRIFPDSER